MTVQELIEQLSKLPSDAEVQLTTQCCGCDVEANAVEDYGEVSVVRGLDKIQKYHVYIHGN